MRRIVFAAMAALFCGPAVAADLPVKAAVVPAPVGCTVTYCVGWIVGADISGIATNVNVFGNGLNGSLNAGGTELGLHGGYRAYNGAIYLGATAGCAYDVSAGTSALGMGFSDRVSCTEIFRVGGSIGALLGQQSFAFPAALQPYFMSFYGLAGGKQKMGSTAVVGGAGAEFVISKKATLRLEYQNAQWGNGGATDTAGIAIPSENLFLIAVDYNF